jgi:ABC-2 type transport system permease protein
MAAHTLYPLYTLWKREVVRFFRQRSRVAGIVLTPLVFWLILGLGFGESFRAVESGTEISYLEFFYPGIILLILLFTSIFSNISLIEDRNEGFLQNVLIAPVTSSGIVAGKVLGGVTIALIQTGLFLILAPFIGYQLNFYIALVFMAASAVVSVGLTSLGFVIAWKLNSIQGFHSIMNVALIPLWLLSGAVFPAEGAPALIQWIVTLNPIGYGVALLRGILHAPIPANAAIISVLFAIILFIAAVYSVRGTRPH